MVMYALLKYILIVNSLGLLIGVEYWIFLMDRVVKFVVETLEDSGAGAGGKRHTSGVAALLSVLGF